MAGGQGTEPGMMDVSQHKKTWAGFVKFIEWSMGGIFLLMLFLLVFRTNG
jgi:hypothetical protein